MQLKLNYHGSLGDLVDLVDLVGLDLGPYGDQNLVPKNSNCQNVVIKFWLIGYHLDNLNS
jgi:hypothetical protein